MSNDIFATVSGSAMGKWYLRCNRRIFPPTNRYLPIKVSVAGALSLARHLACVGVQQELDKETDNDSDPEAAL
jgi:hypothetical protein